MPNIIQWDSLLILSLCLFLQVNTWKNEISTSVYFKCFERLRFSASIYFIVTFFPFFEQTAVPRLISIITFRPKSLMLRWNRSPYAIESPKLMFLCMNNSIIQVFELHNPNICGSWPASIPELCRLKMVLSCWFWNHQMMYRLRRSMLRLYKCCTTCCTTS